MSWLRSLTGLLVVLAIIAGIAAFYNAFAWIADHVLPIPPLPPAPAYPCIAVLSAGIGLFWVLWAAFYLHVVGRGSSVAILSLRLYPTEELVTIGPYGYTRNPTLLGLLLVLLAVALTTRSVTALVSLPIIALLSLEYVRAYEEPVLRQRFGLEYSQYRRSVPALFPRLKRRASR
jgi:protein-S-isoprenylcysteine O-methyltransferase Ste14